MKKIILCIVLFFMMSYKVEAAGVSIRKEYTPMFSTKTTASGQRFNAQLFYLYEGDRIVYCIEPGVDLGSVEYAESASFSEFGISESLQKELELITHYGYEYENHQNLYYYMATQELIWEKMGATDIVWNTGSSYLTDVTTYKNEIRRLIERHSLLPSFANQNFTFKIGTENFLFDQNGVLSTFESKDIKIDGDRILLKSNEVKEEEYTFTQKRKEGTSLLFWAAGSQKVALFRLNESDTHSFSVRVRFEKERGQILLHKKDGVTEEPLEGVIFRLYDENHREIDMKKTDKKGEILWDNIEYGKYYIEEVETLKGYVLASDEIEIKLKESLKEVEIWNQKQNIPITSNIDFIYFGSLSTLLLIGMIGFYASKKIPTI